jgi:type 1 glutamine amidotransferase
VSHFSGTDLIVDYIERYVCPTISSDQLIGGQPFRFAADQRPHVMIVISEPEYETERTLPIFAAEQLRADHRLSFVYGSKTAEHELPGIALSDEADLALISVRRRTPPESQLAVVRRFVAAGKPVLGIRTANHAFCFRNRAPAAGAADWPEWDAEVFGGNYTNHYGRDQVTTVRVLPSAADHPIVRGLPETPFVSGGSLYRVAPLAKGTTPLVQGSVEGHPAEPVAWTYRRADGGKSFYTSLGAPADFDHPAFVRLLRNAVAWASEQ